MCLPLGRRSVLSSAHGSGESRQSAPVARDSEFAMFTTCFFCSGDLDRNEVLEEMPVGRRLAFNERSGRLWVVCRQCERWNLSPLEERWEAIEACERLYRGTRKRVATDNVGLARTAGGLDLIRIGEPLRPEFAAWRYGDQFGRRRRRQLASTGAIAGAFGAVLIGGAWAGVSIASFAGIYANSGIWDRVINGSPDAEIAKVLDANGTVLDVRRRHARMSALLQPAITGEPLSLRLEHKEGTTVLTGAAAARAAQQLLPTVNRFGGSKRAVGEAVQMLEASGGPEAALRALARQRGSSTEFFVGDGMGIAKPPAKLQVAKVPGALHSLPIADRLALEMALHEESERRAMDGELVALEAAWREAEDVARIADSLLESANVRERLHSLRESSQGDTPSSPRASDSANDRGDTPA